MQLFYSLLGILIGVILGCTIGIVIVKLTYKGPQNGANLGLAIVSCGTGALILGTVGGIIGFKSS